MVFFKVSDFDCQDCGKNNMDEMFLQMIDVARNMSGIPFIVNSGYRCIKHNKEIRGKLTSSHLKGLAADIKCSDSSNRMKIIQACISAGFRRIGVGKGFVHVDIDKSKNDAIWVY